MFRYIFSSRTRLAVLAFFVLVVGGSLLYYWHIQPTTENETQRYDQFLRGHQNRDSKTDTSTQQATPIENAVPVKQGIDTADTTNTPQEQMVNSTDTSQDKTIAGTSSSGVQGEILAEEEKTEEPLSAEERRKQELQKRFREIYKEIEGIDAAAGGKITEETHPAEFQQLTRLQKEMLQLMQDSAGDPMFRDLIAISDARQRFQSRLSADGEISVSEAFRIADSIETELGNERGAEEIRSLAQSAIDNGSDVITQAHFDAEFGAAK